MYDRADINQPGRNSFLKNHLLLVSFLFPLTAHSQGPTKVLDTVNATERVIVAGQYSEGSFHQFLFGHHYRKEWNKPVKVKVMMLDTLAGGLTPYEAGGGRQSKSLKLRDRQNREYTLRSLDKSFGRALPEVYQNTFIEDLVDDQVTIGHPYSAVTIAPMAEAAKIYHTNPIIGYVPKQPALDTFNDKFGDLLYLFEQRPDEDWSTAPNFGNSSKIIGTDKLLEKLEEDNDVIVDQQLYIRSRLFDMFIGDWGRHEDQWRWALTEEGGKKIYRPIPRDRDQAYTRFDGVLPKVVLSAANLDYLQTFDEGIDHVKVYNYTARHLDRRMANETTLEQWVETARDLQSLLTDEVITSAIQRLPPEVYNASGPRTIFFLKERRARLERDAREYYFFLARHVDVPGTKKDEYFDIRRINDDQTSVQVYKLKNGNRDSEPFYSRIFKTDETKDIRLYGIDGHDVYNLDGDVGKGIKVRLIGGPDHDSLIDGSSVAGLSKLTQYYDDRDNYIDRSPETNLHIHLDSAIHAYDYNEFKYHKRGLRFSVFYNNPDRIYTSLGYGFKRHMWRKYPYGFEQALYLRYSISQNAYSVLYEGDFYQWVGKWNLKLSANYDAIRWTNFFGLGNETKRVIDTRDYYQLRTNEFVGSVGLNRTFHKYHHVDLTAFFQGVEIIDDKGRFVTDQYTEKQLFYFDHHQYLGARLGYTYQNVNDNAVPTRGVMFYAGAAYSNNIQESDKSFTTYNGILQLYFPLFSKFSISSRNGLTHVAGEPEFYQYASIGGSQNMRGFARDRFWGQTAFYNTNELRWITNFHTYIMNGKAGLIGFVDDGRVWMPNENSDVWHVGYGGGIMLAPFNKFSVSLTYGVSDDDQRLHVRFNKLLFDQ